MNTKLLFTLCIAMGIGGSAFAEQTDSQMIITKGENGTAVIDATGNHTMLPSRLSSSASAEELFTFFKDTLNGQLVYDDAGKLVGVTGTTIIYGTPLWVNKSNEVVAAHDPVFTLSGRVPSTQSNALPSRSQTCTAGGADCIAGQSSNTHTNVGIVRYDSVGGETAQVRGGYHVEHHFCWLWGFIPWSCSTGVGSNALQVSVVYYMPNASNGGGPPGVGRWNTTPIIANQQNTESVQVRQWSFTFAGVSSIVQQFSGVCSQHNGNTGWTMTEDGDTGGQCGRGPID